MRHTLIALPLLLLSACNNQGPVANQAEDVAFANESVNEAAGDPIAAALAAAPESIAKGASVVAGDGKTLKAGSNGWTCMPDNPQTPGTDPMCLDKAGLAWAQAWMGKKDPDPAAVGLAYMLQGGSDASNMDPFATQPAPEGKWVDTGPHIMILNAKLAESSGYPKGDHPDTAVPYVMFGGTPYAHIMMPVR